MKQQIEDLKLRFKNDRRVWAVLGLCVLALFLWMGTTKRRTARPRAGYEMGEASQPNSGGQEAFNDLFHAVQDSLGTLNEKAREQQERQDRVEKEIRAQNEKTAGVISMMVERLEGLDDAVKTLQTAPAQTTTVEQPVDAAPVAAPEPDELTTIGFKDAPPPPPPLPPVQERHTFIAPGDTVLVKLLSGVAAPVDGTPYPVVFKLLGPITGPDGSALDVGEARLIAAAQGSETDARVIYRLTDLAFRHHDGRRTVVKVDGWIVGEDGIRGMRGKVIDKLGQLILTTAMYSGTAALAERLDKKSDNVDIDTSGDVTIQDSDLTSATTSAFTDASQRLTELLLDKYEKLVPVVEVRAGREVAAVFAKGAEVSIYDEEEDDAGTTLAAAMD